MGAIGDAVVAYAQPLIDATDGSLQEMEKALAISQFCWNLALQAEDAREKSLREMRATLHMDDDEFDDFRRTLLGPMIRRHEEMFPRLHRRVPRAPSFNESAPRSNSREPTATEKHPDIDRYAPCPCNSGRKYKFCCGASRR
ncbi:MAG: SEC-C metal-binding domain-containing protein [Deltaproteobacteria bacterium]